MGSTAGPLQHHTLLYDDDDQYLETLVPFLRRGLDAGRPAIAVVPERKTPMLRGGLGDDADHVQFIASESWYDTPARTIAGYDRALTPLNGQRPHVIGEVHFGDRQANYPAWVRYEAALNRVLDHLDCMAVCPYDTRSVPAPLVDGARHSHPLVATPDGTAANDAYSEPEHFLAESPLSVSIPDAPPDLSLAVNGGTPAARRTLLSALSDHGFSRDHCDELIVALNEVMTNCVVHGPGAGMLRAWFNDGSDLVVAVEDDGQGVRDLYAGLRPPHVGAEQGRGLWLARQIFPRVEVISGPDGGTTVLLAADRH